MRQILLATTTAMLFTAASAFADQITYGPSVQDVTFTKTATGLSVTAPQLDFHQATDTTNAGSGGAWILGLNLTTGPEVNGFFTANPNSETFIYTAADGGGGPVPTPGGDSLTETIHITTIQDDTTQPKIFFVGDAPSSIQGDAAFIAAFSGPDVGDWIQNSLGVTLTNLVGSAASTVSAGEKVPSTSPVPEPAALTLLASAFFGLAWLGRRRV
jgi:hypothetical protein